MGSSVARVGGRDPLILHVVESGGLYGIERMLLALLPALKDSGTHAGLCCLGISGTPGGAVADAAARLGVETFLLDSNGRAGPRVVGRIAGLLLRRRPALMHFHGYKATILGGVIGRALGIPGIATYHMRVDNVPGLARHVRLETPVLRRLRTVVAVSEQIAGDLRTRGVSASAIRVIPNGIPKSDPSRSTDRGRFSIVIVGRLVREKNVHLAIESVAALRPRWPRVRLVVVGDGPFRAELERRVRELGAADAVEFTGFLADVRPTLASADAFVMPSESEGMPMAILEAMAARVPIVASAVGSIPDVVRPEREAVLVPPNDVHALTVAIERLLLDPDGATERAASAFARFEERFTAKAMSTSYAEVYDAILQGA